MRLYNISMRLTEHQKKSIIENSKIIFGEDSKIYLFGSRVDDNKRGGDIDLFVECAKDKNNYDNKISFVARLYVAIGEQKIDVVLKTIDEEDDRLIVSEALSKGILLS